MNSSIQGCFDHKVGCLVSDVGSFEKVNGRNVTLNKTYKSKALARQVVPGKAIFLTRRIASLCNEIKILINSVVPMSLAYTESTKEKGASAKPLIQGKEKFYQGA